MCSPQSTQDFFNNAVGSIYFSKKGRSEEISGSYICDQSPEILRNRGRKAEEQKKKAGAGELFASLTPAKPRAELTKDVTIFNCLRIA